MFRHRIDFMKKLLFLSSGFLLTLSSCVFSDKNPNEFHTLAKGIDVTIRDGEHFPVFLVGTWRADDSVWEINFEPNGIISTAVIELAAARMKPGEICTFPTRGGGKGVFEPGQWHVAYEAETRILTVEIALKNFYQDIGQYAIEGNNYDIISGHVSEDGSIWKAEKYNYGRWIMLTPEPNELHDIKEPIYKGELLFEKLQ